MSVRDQVLENHTLVVRDGRIIDLLPCADARLRYEATALIRRESHLLLPGLINAHTSAASGLFRGSAALQGALKAPYLCPEFVRDGVLAALAEMLLSGMTCFADRYYFPQEAARAAHEQGMRALVGLAVGAEQLTEGLRVRDDYGAHPLVSTFFAPPPPNEVGDAAFGRLAALADELDAGIMIDLHTSAREIEESLAQYGKRPIERLWQLGLLTPALHAVHATQMLPADIDLAHRTGIAISLNSALGRDAGTLPALLDTPIRLGLGTGGSVRGNQDLWRQMRWFAQLAPQASAWDALALATRGGAAVLGLDADIGTLEKAKWADVCCVDLSGPSVQPLRDPIAQMVFCGGGELVSDVWVAGRQLLSNRELTRLDWPAVAARAQAWSERINTGASIHG